MSNRQPSYSKLPFSQRESRGLASAFLNSEEFIDQHSSVRTRNAYAGALRTFADWLQCHSGIYSLVNQWPLNPNYITVKMVLTFRSDLGKKYKPATVRNRMAGVIGYLTWLEGENELPDGLDLGRLVRQSRAAARRSKTNVSEHVSRYDIERQRIPEVLTWYDEQSLPAGAFDKLLFLRNRALINVLFFTAARVSEVVSINRNQVEDGQLKIIITGKGNKSRTIHIDEHTQTYIQQYLAARPAQRQTDDGKPEALFLPHSRNTSSKRLTANQVGRFVKRLFKSLGLHPDLSPHDIRHFRALELLRKGLPLVIIQEMLGHASIKTTRDIYAPVLGADLVAAALHGAGR